MNQVRPRVLFSKCLGFESCRYNGEIIRDDFIERLKLFVEPVTVCPEMEIGLGVPRPPIRIMCLNGDIRLIQPAAGIDLTGRMRDFVRSFLERLEEVDGFVLKSRSPSCGIRDVRVFNQEGNIHQAFAGKGFFAGAVMDRFTAKPVEDEERLKNLLLREGFLFRLFALARLRQLRSNPSIDRLVEFHTRHKLLLLAFSPNGLKQLGRLVANPRRRQRGEVISDYEAIFSRVLARPPKFTSAINVLLDSLGYFKEKLSSQEKAFFLHAIEGYRRGKLPLSVPVSLIRSYIVRLGEPYLEKQVFFQPYPEELTEVPDPGGKTDAGLFKFF